MKRASCFPQDNCSSMSPTNFPTAGQNFGVVTEFLLQAYPQKEMYMGTLLFVRQMIMSTASNCAITC